MQLVALSNFHIGLREAAEVIHRGDTFAAQGNGTMNAREVGQALIRGGNACLPEDAEKRLAKSQVGWDWAQAEVSAMRDAYATSWRRASK